jgi:hypothetical protein
MQVIVIGPVKQSQKTSRYVVQKVGTETFYSVLVPEPFTAVSSEEVELSDKLDYEIATERHIAIAKDKRGGFSKAPSVPKGDVPSKAPSVPGMVVDLVLEAHLNMSHVMRTFIDHQSDIGTDLYQDVESKMTEVQIALEKALAELGHKPKGPYKENTASVKEQDIDQQEITEEDLNILTEGPSKNKQHASEPLVEEMSSVLDELNKQAEIV